METYFTEEKNTLSETTELLSPLFQWHFAIFPVDFLKKNL